MSNAMCSIPSPIVADITSLATLIVPRLSLVEGGLACVVDVVGLHGVLHVSLCYVRLCEHTHEAWTIWDWGSTLICSADQSFPAPGIHPPYNMPVVIDQSAACSVFHVHINHPDPPVSYTQVCVSNDRAR